MNVSLNWLKEYVDLDNNISVQEIVDKLTMSGSKVEKYVKFGEKVEGVYTAMVTNVSMHPVRNELSVVTVDMGGKFYKIVAKIPDIRVGDIVPVALENSKIIGKEVKKVDVDGVMSEAMICHILDFGLTKEMLPIVRSSGLIAFPNDVEVGKDVNEVLDLGDYIIEFEITPNRPDCLSVEGIARELAVTFGLECKPLWQDKEVNLLRRESIDGITTNIDTENCNNYVLNVAKDVSIKDAPWDMRLKLMKCGYGTKNNIVDITNFVMLEMGQPLHAFDKNLLRGNIVVRQAKENEEITLLDETKKVLCNSDMLITDDNGPIAVAGVMGGVNSAIKSSTISVVFEAASFVRGSIRNTSKRLQVRTDASSKYEKGLPTELTKRAMQRVINLVNSNGFGIMTEDCVIKENVHYEQYTMDIDYAKINRVVGLKLSENEINKILESLNIQCMYGKATIPYYRDDIRITEDLAEEVARIYGLDKLDSTMPQTSSTFGLKSDKRKFEDSIKSIALASTYNQIYTYTFYSLDTLKRLGVPESDSLYTAVKIANPLSKEFAYMRTTTVPHMLEALERNYLRKNTEAKLFELGKVFLDAKNIEKGELCMEKQILTLGAYGSKIDFYDIKDTVIKMMNKFRVKTQIRRSNKSYMHPGISADILSENGEVLATIGKVSPLVISNYDLPENTYIATVDVEKVRSNATFDVKYSELPKFPAVERDIAFIISDEVLSSEIVKCIEDVDKEIVEDVTLFDVYKGKQIEENMQSMAYKIRLRSKEKTLTDDVIKDFTQKLVDMLEDKFKVTIRK